MSKVINKDLERLLKRVSLSASDWDSLAEDLKDGIPTVVILSKYNIKKHYLKLFKRFYIGV